MDGRGSWEVEMELRAPSSSGRTTFMALGRDSLEPRPTDPASLRSSPYRWLSCTAPLWQSRGTAEQERQILVVLRGLFGFISELFFKIQFKTAIVLFSSQMEHSQAENDRMCGIWVCNKHFFRVLST